MALAVAKFRYSRCDGVSLAQTRNAGRASAIRSDLLDARDRLVDRLLGADALGARWSALAQTFPEHGRGWIGGRGAR